MMQFRFSSFLVLSCWINLLGLAGFPLFAESSEKLMVLDRIVASVNGDAITESELHRQTQLLLVRLRQTDTTLPALPVLRKQLLEKMILEKLQLQLATTEGIEVNDEIINHTIEDIAKRDNLSVHQMQQFLEEQGITTQQFRETVKTEMTISKIQQKEVGQHISVSKAEIENFIHSPAGLDHSDIEYRLGHILVSLPEDASKEQFQTLKGRAEALAQELKNGANFAKTALAQSSGQQALNGGDLGWRKIASVPSLFAKATATLKVGEIYGPIQDNSGFHIVTLLDKRNNDLRPTKQKEETQRNKAMEILYQRKFDESLVSWLRHLRSDADVAIYLNEV